MLPCYRAACHPCFSPSPIWSHEVIYQIRLWYCPELCGEDDAVLPEPRRRWTRFMLSNIKDTASLARGYLTLISDTTTLQMFLTALCKRVLCFTTKQYFSVFIDHHKLESRRLDHDESGWIVPCHATQHGVLRPPVETTSSLTFHFIRGSAWMYRAPYDLGHLCRPS